MLNHQVDLDDSRNPSPSDLGKAFEMHKHLALNVQGWKFWMKSCRKKGKMLMLKTA